MNDIEYLKKWNKDLEWYDDEQEAIEVHKRCIEALKFSARAKELLEACVQLFNKQLDSPYVLNLLNELIYYDECECDGDCLMGDIIDLLEYGV